MDKERNDETNELTEDVNKYKEEMIKQQSIFEHSSISWVNISWNSNAKDEINKKDED